MTERGNTTVSDRSQRLTSRVRANRVARACRAPGPLGIVILLGIGWFGSPLLRAEDRLVVTLGFEPIVEASSSYAVPHIVPGLLRERVLGLGEALGLAGGENPRIALADEVVRASEAERTLARAMLLPQLHVGMNYRHHDGPLLTAGGVIRDVDLRSLYYGFGADAKGAGTVAIPGIRLAAHLGDAMFAPRAAQFLVSSRRFDAEAMRNRVLQEVAARYLRLSGTQARLEAMQESIAELGEIERLTADHARTGQGRDSDAQRARAETELLRSASERIVEERDVAAAELARYLTLDPEVRLRAADPAPPLLELVDPRTPMADLLATALRRNPEIAARGSDIGISEARWKQEKLRPWLPVLTVGFSAGEFGGGSDLTRTRFGNFDARTDFDVLAVWTIQGFGLGNRARRDIARAQVGQAESAQRRVIDRVRAEVAEAVSVVLARRVELDITRTRMEAAAAAYRQDLARTRNLQARPIEVLSSATMLAAARQDLLQARVAYSEAQLRLLLALGEPPPPAPGHP